MTQRSAHAPNIYATEPLAHSPAPYRVIAASDFSELGDRAVHEALRLCGLQGGSVLYVITVAAEAATGVRLPGPETRILPVTEAREAARLRVAQIVDSYRSQGQPIAMKEIAVYLVTGSPAERIVALATAMDADLIVLGTHGRHGLSRVFLGSVATEVVERAPCGVFVIRPREFLLGEKLPQVEPPLKQGQHSLLPFRESATYHHIDRDEAETTRMMPAI
jgi:nucleotide-binding universal stress UspA family protein